MLTFADCSEFQSTVDWAAYAAGGYPAAVCRVSYGIAHVDLQADNNIAGMRAHLRVRGFYGYLVASQDPTAQGRCFAQVLLAHGGLRAGEWVAVDVEEGTGNQEVRAQAWLDAVNATLHASKSQDVEYSGLNFAATHTTWIPGETRWVAAYQPNAPAAGQTFWQYSDARTFPGIAHPCDASVFNGTLNQLLALINPPQPPTALKKEAEMFVAISTDDRKQYLCEAGNRTYIGDSADLKLLFALTGQTQAEPASNAQLDRYWPLPS